MSRRKDSRFDNIEITFTNRRVSRQAVMDILCESITNVIKTHNSFASAIFIKLADIKDFCCKIFKKGDIILCQNSPKANEL